MLSWSLAQQNWLGSSNHGSLKLSRASDISSVPLLSPCWETNYGLEMDLLKKFSKGCSCTAPVMGSPESSSSYRISRLIPEAQLTWFSSLCGLKNIIYFSCHWCTCSWIWNILRDIRIWHKDQLQQWNWIGPLVPWNAILQILNMALRFLIWAKYQITVGL